MNTTVTRIKSQKPTHTHTHTHTQIAFARREYSARFAFGFLAFNFLSLFPHISVADSYAAAVPPAAWMPAPQTAQAQSDAADQAELYRKIQIRDSLKSEIAQIDSEISRCNKAKTNWTAATVVGGVGVVGTGIGAIVQNNQIQQKKKELNNLK